MKLFLLQPEVIFTARVNAATFNYPLDKVTYDNVTVGTYSVVALSQMVIFGSTEGADDLGRSWVRLFPTSDTLYFGRSSQGVHDGEVSLTDNCWISVLNLFVVANKTPYIDADGELFKNSDVAFVDQTNNSNPVANAGPAFAATIDPDTGVITVVLSAADSFATAPGAAIVSTIWEVGAGGTITAGAFDDETITVEYEAGFRYARLTVADDNAKGHQAVVPVLAIDPDDDPCINAFTIERHTIAPDGQQITVNIRQPISIATYPEGTLAMVLDGEPVDGNDRDNVHFCGWVDTEPAGIEGTAVGLLTEVQLDLLDVAGRLRQLPGFSQIWENAATPENWSQATDPNMDRFLHYLLDWSSTALHVADFYWSGTGSTYAFKILASDGASLWDQVARKAGSMVPDYVFTCDRRGRLRLLPDPLLLDPGDRPTVEQADLGAEYVAALRWAAQRAPTVHWLRSSAIVASNDEVTAVFCVAPGTAPGQGLGAVDDGENLAVSQAALNAYAGHKYARINARYGLFTVTLPGSGNSAYDPALLGWVALSLGAEVAAPRGLTLGGLRFLLRRVEVRYNHAITGLTKQIDLTVEMETSGPAAVTVTPATADPPDTGDYIPPDTSTTPPDFDGGLSATPQNIALITDDGRYIRTSTFGSSPPTWAVNNSIQASINGDGMGFVVDPFSPLYRTGAGTVDGFYVTTTRIYKISDIFGTPAATSLHTFAEAISNSGGRWRSIAASFGRFEPVEADNPWIMVATAYNSGITSRQGLYIIYSRDGGQTWSSEIQVSAFKPSGTLSGARYWPVIWMSPRTPGYAIVIAKTQTGAIGGTGAYFTTDWGATWAALTLPAVVTSPQSTTGGLAGGALHVPWPGNVDEQIIYHGYEVEQASDWQRYLYRTTGSTSEDITPAAGNYGPRWGLFAVRSYDGDRRYMVAALADSNTDDDILAESSAIFVSSDYGDTWTLSLGPATTAANAQYPAQAAFSGTDHNAIFVWGNEGYIQFSDDFGTSWENKRGSMAFTGGEEILGLVGGDA